MTKTQEHCATMSSEGQVVVPSDVRKRLGLVQGSVLRFVLEADGVRLLGAAGDVRRLKGRLATPARAVTVDEMSRAVAERRRGARAADPDHPSPAAQGTGNRASSASSQPCRRGRSPRTVATTTLSTSRS